MLPFAAVAFLEQDVLEQRRPLLTFSQRPGSNAENRITEKEQEQPLSTNHVILWQLADLV